MLGSRSSWWAAGLVSLAVSVVGPGVAHADELSPVTVTRTAAVFAEVDSLNPLIVATLEPGRHQAFPACRQGDTEMVWIRFALAGALPGPSSVGWINAGALDLSESPTAC
jgi:hypothetical protein